MFIAAVFNSKNKQKIKTKTKKQSFNGEQNVLSLLSGAVLFQKGTPLAYHENTLRS